jgi:type IV secretion system protein VirB6
MNTVGLLSNLILGASGHWSGGASLPTLQVAANQLSDLLFFREINSFLTGEIDVFRDNLLGRTVSLLGGAVMAVVTLWILIEGYRIAVGHSRDSMMALVTRALRVTVIVGVATAAAAGGGSMYRSLTDGLSSDISRMVTGTDDDVYERIDKCLAYMQVALASIDALDVADDPILNEKKDRDLWFAGIGTGGPALMAGTMLLLNKIAMALFVGLGPLFILCLLFDQTKGLFGRWLYYGLGTIFSLAVLSVMVTLATDMIIAVAAAFWTSSLLGAGPDGVNSMALQQGGLGLVLTMLILTAPPMAAMFFQGTMGSFVPYSQFGGGAHGRSSTPGPQGQPPGSYHQAPGSGQASALRTGPVASATTAYGPASYRLPSQASRADAIKTSTP